MSLSKYSVKFFVLRDNYILLHKNNYIKEHFL